MNFGFHLEVCFTTAVSNRLKAHGRPGLWQHLLH